MRKSTFSYEEKVNIVREHEENHKTLKEVCLEYDISKSYLCLLLRQYRNKGKESLKSTRYYSNEYKLSVVKRHFEDGISIVELTRETGIQHRMLVHWMDKYTKGGYKGLTIIRKRGRRRKLEVDTPEERIKQLEMENEILRVFLEECERWDVKE